MHIRLDGKRVNRGMEMPDLESMAERAKTDRETIEQEDERCELFQHSRTPSGIISVECVGFGDGLPARLPPLLHERCVPEPLASWHLSDATRDPQHGGCSGRSALARSHHAS